MESLELLRSFVALAEERHFTRAAARLRVAQPALSKRIQQLEAELGLTLFDRSRRGAALTAEGAALLASARAVLDATAQLLLAARTLAAGDTGTLRIGFAPSAPHHVLPALMRTFRRQHPE